MRAVSLDIVLHLAAFKIPRYGKATDTMLINSQGTLNALHLRSNTRAKFVITSTSDVYGKNPQVPFAEDGDSVFGPPTISRWAYAASKLFDEHLVLGDVRRQGHSVNGHPYLRLVRSSAEPELVGRPAVGFH